MSVVRITVGLLFYLLAAVPLIIPGRPAATGMRISLADDLLLSTQSQLSARFDIEICGVSALEGWHDAVVDLFCRDAWWSKLQAILFEEARSSVVREGIFKLLVNHRGDLDH